jgi:hypothetical protein
MLALAYGAAFGSAAGASNDSACPALRDEIRNLPPPQAGQITQSISAK